MRSLPFTIRLDGEFVQSEDQFHAELREQSGIEWYGCNLNALDEMLSSIIPEAWGPFRIVWENADLSLRAFSQNYLMIVGVLKTAEERFPDRFVEFKMSFAEPYFDEGQDPFLNRP